MGQWLAGTLGVLSLAAACGHAPSAGDPYYDRLLAPGRLEPATAEERQVLARAGELPTGERVSIAGVEVEADRPYFAASGRPCRRMRVRQAEREADRVACVDGAEWVFVPDSLGTSGANP